MPHYIIGRLRYARRISYAWPWPEGDLHSRNVATDRLNPRGSNTSIALSKRIETFTELLSVAGDPILYDLGSIG